MQSCSCFSFFRKDRQVVAKGKGTAWFLNLFMLCYQEIFLSELKDLFYSHSPLYTIPVATPVIIYKET